MKQRNKYNTFKRMNTQAHETEMQDTQTHTQTHLIGSSREKDKVKYEKCFQITASEKERWLLQDGDEFKNRFQMHNKELLDR